VSATVIIGAGGCAVIGGLGVRLAMRILFLTSGDGVKGLTSDDGYKCHARTRRNRYLVKRGSPDQGRKWPSRCERVEASI
jgi:hypothetical protein